MSALGNDYPGFYRDPTTGRYFFDNGDPNNSSLRKLKRERATETEMEKRKKFRSMEIPNVYTCLRNRQLGLIDGISHKKAHYRLKVFKRKLIQDTSLLGDQSTPCVDFIRGGEKSVFGIWRVSSGYKQDYIAGEQCFADSLNEMKLGSSVSPQNVVDMCEGPDQTLICLHNAFSQTQGSFQYLSRGLEMNVPLFDSATLTKIPIYCCSTGRESNTYGIGCHGFVNTFNEYSPVHNIIVEGRTHTLSFDRSSDLIASGNHEGTLSMLDPRVKDIVTRIQVSDGALMDSLFFDSVNVFVAGVPNKLFKVDLRIKTIVTEYARHQHSIRKTPFSVANDMLCAAGSDNVLRIWHLSGGSPIYEMKPENPANLIRGWIHEDSNKTRLFYFEGNKKKIFVISSNEVDRP